MPDNVYNATAVKATKTLQKRAKIEPVSGNVGKATFEASRYLKKKGSRTEYAWDAYRVDGYNQAVAAMSVPTEAEVRKYIAEQLYIMYVNRDAISYSQERAVWAIINRVINPMYAKRIDCSGTAIYGGALAFWHFRKEGINVPPYDPTYGNSGYGNTWSLIGGGRRVSRSQAKVGDLVFYNGHVATVANVSDGAVSVVSMGSNPGPLYLPDNYRSDIQQYRTYNLREVIK
jgi:hypothetical protein